MRGHVRSATLGRGDVTLLREFLVRGENRIAMNIEGARQGARGGELLTRNKPAAMNFSQQGFGDALGQREAGGGVRDAEMEALVHEQKCEPSAHGDPSLVY